MKVRDMVIWGLGGLVAAFVLLNFFWVGGIPGWMIRVPSARDPQLVGTWAGTAPFHSHILTLNADGTGRCLWGFQWGTKDGTLFLKYRSAGEGWEAESSTYRINPSSGSVVFGKSHLFIPSRMSRILDPAPNMIKLPGESSPPYNRT